MRGQEVFDAPVGPRATPDRGQRSCHPHGSAPQVTFRSLRSGAVVLICLRAWQNVSKGFNLLDVREKMH